MFVCMRSKPWSNYKSNSTWMSKPGRCSVNKSRYAHSTLTFPHKFTEINCWHISAKAILHQYCSNTLVIRASRVCSNLLPTHFIEFVTQYITDTLGTEINLLIVPQWHIWFHHPPPPHPPSWVSNYQPQLNSHRMKPMKYDSAPGRAIKSSNTSVQWWRGLRINK